MNKDDVESPTPVVHTSDVSKGSVSVGRENLHRTLAPHASYEGAHRFDPTAEWCPEEEKRVILKTDLRLMIWLCLMVRPNCFTNYSVIRTDSC